MGSTRFRSGNHNQGLVIILSVMVLGLSSLGSAWAQEENPKPIFPDTTVVVGSRFFVFFRLPNMGLERPRLEFPSVLDKIAIDPVAEAYLDTVSPDSVNATGALIVRVGVRALRAGWTEFPSMTLVFANDQRIQTNADMLGIALPGPQSLVPPDLVWELRTPSLMAGQTTMIDLMVVNAQSLVLPESVTLGPTPGLELVPVAITSSSTRTTLHGKEFLSLPAGSWALTATSPGTHSIPETRLDFGTWETVVPARTFAVGEAPSGIAATGAIGQFTVVMDHPDKVLVNEPFTLTLRIEGRGNLTFLSVPNPDFGNAQIQGTTASSRLEAVGDGFRGYQEKSYRLVLPEPGIFRPSLAPYVFWNTNDQALGRATLPEVIIEVESREDVQKRMEIIVPEPDQALVKELTVFTLFSPGWVISLVVFLLLILVAGRFGTAWDFGLLGLAVLISLLGLVLWGPRVSQDALFLYEDAVQSHRQGNTAQTHRALVEALDKAPQSATLGKIIKNYRLDGGFGDPAPQLPRVSLNAMTVIFSFSLLMVVFLLRLPNKSPILKRLFIILCTSGMAVSLLFIGFYGVHEAQTYGYVANDDVVVRKIPNVAAKEWHQVTKGTMVKILATHDGFILFETSYRIQGWALESQVLRATVTGNS